MQFDHRIDICSLRWLSSALSTSRLCIDELYSTLLCPAQAGRVQPSCTQAACLAASSRRSMNASSQGSPQSVQ